MGYRDDSETLRARIEVLESELAVVKDENARLKGEAPVVAGAVTSKAHWLFGAPTNVLIRRDFNGTPTAAGIRAVREVLEKRHSDGRLMSFDNDLWFKAGSTDFTLTPGEGMTRMELQVNHGWVALPAYLGILLTTYVICAVAAVKLDPALGFTVTLPIALLVTGLLVRLFGRHYLRALERRAYGTFESLAAVVGEHIDPTSKRKVRIAPEPAPEPVDEAPPSAKAVAR